ncbi:hypothetical protein [Pseudophaeobacter arcticus]|jgi:hypothetical protein|uniref:hypothetical protein n=1 Tax=Pseudophaeobacter arcticus TaxID=385492 RepID=UPI0039E48F42
MVLRLCSSLSALHRRFRLFCPTGEYGAEWYFLDPENRPADNPGIAVDFLAPWFEPDREALVVPPGTRVQEYTGVDETETHATGARVTGLRAGAVANRQLAIYDKRQEVMQKGKLGWLTIWNDARAQLNHPPLDLSDQHPDRQPPAYASAGWLMRYAPHLGGIRPSVSVP